MCVTCANCTPAIAVRVTFHLLDFDAKRLHYFEELRHAEAGWLSATSENMALHVDMAARKTAPFPAPIAAQLARMKAAHATLPAARRRRPAHRHAGEVIDLLRRAASLLRHLPP